MQELEITFSHVLQIWWAYTWRVVLYGVLFGAEIGLLVGCTGFAFGYDNDDLMLLCQIFGSLISIPISIWVISKILNKKFSSFRIALISVNNFKL